MNWLRISLCTLLMASTAIVSSHAKNFEGKIGFVDLSRTFDEYEKTKEYDKVLEVDHSAFEEKRNALIEEIRDQQGKLALLKEEERAKLEAELEAKKQALLEFDREKRTDLTKARDERVREILLEIEKVVSDYAKKEDYAFILNDRVLIFGGDEYNLTDVILQKLNDDYKKNKK